MCVRRALVAPGARRAAGQRRKRSPMRIEDYALSGDLQTAALVGRNGSVDWLCLPRFDSASCFAALLGDESHGRWLIAPAGETRATSRRYRPGTLVLETEFETAEGRARRVDRRRRGDLSRAEAPICRRPSDQERSHHDLGRVAFAATCLRDVLRQSPERGPL